MADMLYGKNGVREALRAGRRAMHRLWVVERERDGTERTPRSTRSNRQPNGQKATQRGDPRMREVVELAEQLGIPVASCDRRTLDSRLRGTQQPNQPNHQGVALETGDYPYVDLEDCIEVAHDRRETPLLLLLDHIQDPQNVGTLLRTADIAHVHGVVLLSRRSASITPAVVNASSGATEHLAIAQETNLVQAIKTLKKHGIWVAGVENDERATPFDQTDLAMPLALVMGAEGTGLARLTREHCDFFVNLPMQGNIESLNVAVAGSIVLYHTWRQRAKPEG
jgi:23S rRNA (guanosine2251-2'-O)-methyltransferase